MGRHFIKCIFQATAIITAILTLGGCSLRGKTHIEGKPAQILTLGASDASDSGQIEYDKTEQLYAALEDGFKSEYIILNTYTMKSGYSDAETFILTRMRYVSKLAKLKELLPQALQSVYDKTASLYPAYDITHVENITYPNWQYLAAALPYATTESYLLYEVLCIDISATETDNASVEIKISASPVPIREFAACRANEAEPAEAANTYMDIRYTYAYLTALYDENGNYVLDVSNSDNATSASDVNSYDFAPSYEDGLVYPLDNVINFRDTWAQGRSNNTRQHVGTDIKQPRNTNIYSCSSGVVLYKGTDDIPGNYVIILDDSGFEYHYYHLVDLPTEVNKGDRVNAGQLIGHVGNTGNSDANHLHISLITPDGVFINPYMLLKQLAARK